MTDEIPDTLEEREFKEKLKPYFDERDRRINALMDIYFARQTPFWKIILGGMIFVGAIITTVMTIMTLFQLLWKALGLE